MIDLKLIYDNINNYSQEDYSYFLSIIKEEKHNKILKILNENDKKRSILGELLFIELLKELKIDYNSIQIYKNKNGKPYIENKNIYFNISHSNDYVVCAISNNEIGIDIEKIRTINPNVIKQFATVNEIEYIKKQDSYFKKCFEIFTLKESYFKCLGTNLNYIKKVEFKISENLIRCSDKNISCQLIYDINDYIIAICEKRNG